MKILEIIIFVDFVKKNIESDKVRDYCHLTGDYRGPALSKCNFNVTQDQSNFIPFIFHNFSNYHCHMFFKKLFDKKNDKKNLILYLKQMKNILVLLMVVIDL